MESTDEAASDKPRKGWKRRATQQKIMDAFERVLLRDGVSGLGINAVVAEADVGKGLIYRYFGDLEGLAEAWMQRARLAPTEEEVVGGDPEAFASLPARDRLARIHVNYATMLRDKPAACEILAEDLQAGSALPAVMEEIRLQLGRSHESLLANDPEFHDEDHMALIFVLQAAANYLALRANASPNYNGIRLDTEEGWSSVMAMLERVALHSG